MREFRTLIGTQELFNALSDDSLVVIDCRYQLSAGDAGERAYRASHIPGALYAHLSRDLSQTGSANQGRHPLPDPELLGKKFSAWGIDKDTQVVGYDDAGGAMAARLWWLLRWLGHSRVALLDGGWTQWLAEQRPVESAVKKPLAADFHPQVQPAMTATAGELMQPDVLLLDARGRKRFTGEEEPLDKKAGHIPGARNYPYVDNLDEQGLFKSAQELKTQLLKVIADVPADRVINSCGSGVSACHNLLAMEIAGLSGARLYPPSWSGWIADPGNPIATGS